MTCSNLFRQQRQVNSHKVDYTSLIIAWTTQLIVESEGCFSQNEEADDIKTSDMPLLLIPYAIGEILSTCPSDPSSSSSPSATSSYRLSLVSRSLSQYHSFLHLLNNYKLLGDLASSQYIKDEDEGEEDENGVRVRRMDPTTKRQEKIDRFKQDKAIAAQIEQIKSRRKQVDESDDQENDDEEEMRRLWLLIIESASLRSLEQRSFLVEELRIIKGHIALSASNENQLASMSPQDRDRRLKQLSEEQQVEQQMREMVLTGLHKVASSLAQPPGQGQGQASSSHPLPLDGRREELMRGVFKPSHTMPTMTVEEFGEQEMRLMAERQRNIDEAASEGLRDKNMSVGIDSLSRKEREREEEREEERKRQWDDWKDENPKGQGNSALRNCGR